MSTIKRSAQEARRLIGGQRLENRCDVDKIVNALDAAAILKTLPEYNRLQKHINEPLAEQLPKGLFNNPKRLAIDLVLIPCHGQHCYNINKIDRSQPKSGTSPYFQQQSHAYVTDCVLQKGFRYTVALTPVVKGEEMKAVVKRLETISILSTVRNLWLR